MKAEHAWRVLERAGVPRRCAFCHREYELEVDHINGNHYDDRLENLRFFCRPCHLARHIDPKGRWWKPEDWVHCNICGKLCLCGFSPESDTYVCPACFREKFWQTHPNADLSDYSSAYGQFLNSQYFMVESRKEIQLVEGFAERCLETDHEAFELQGKVYSVFINFCAEEELPKMTKMTFSIRLPQCVSVRVGWYKSPSDKRVYCWRGIRLKNFGKL